MCAVCHGKQHVVDWQRLVCIVWRRAVRVGDWLDNVYGVCIWSVHDGCGDDDMYSVCSGAVHDVAIGGVCVVSKWAVQQRDVAVNVHDVCRGPVQSWRQHAVRCMWSWVVHVVVGRQQLFVVPCWHVHIYVRLDVVCGVPIGTLRNVEWCGSLYSVCRWTVHHIADVGVQCVSRGQLQHPHGSVDLHDVCCGAVQPWQHQRVCSMSERAVQQREWKRQLLRMCGRTVRWHFWRDVVRSVPIGSVRQGHGRVGVHSMRRGSVHDVADVIVHAVCGGQLQLAAIPGELLDMRGRTVQRGSSSAVHCVCSGPVQSRRRWQLHVVCFGAVWQHHGSVERELQRSVRGWLLRQFTRRGCSHVCGRVYRWVLLRGGVDQRDVSGVSRGNVL